MTFISGTDYTEVKLVLFSLCLTVICTAFSKFAKYSNYIILMESNLVEKYYPHIAAEDLRQNGLPKPTYAFMVDARIKLGQPNLCQSQNLDCTLNLPVSCLNFLASGNT